MTVWDYLDRHGGVAWTWTLLLFVLALMALAAASKIGGPRA